MLSLQQPGPSTKQRFGPMETASDLQLHLEYSRRSRPFSCQSQYSPKQKRGSISRQSPPVPSKQKSSTKTSIELNPKTVNSTAKTEDSSSVSKSQVNEKLIQTNELKSV